MRGTRLNKTASRQFVRLPATLRDMRRGLVCTAFLFLFAFTLFGQSPKPGLKIDDLNQASTSFSVPLKLQASWSWGTLTAPGM